MPEAPELRPIGVADWAQSVRLGRLAFGGDMAAPIDDIPVEDARDRLGLFRGDRLVAKLSVIPYEQFFGGRAVPMGGVAGVAVVPEERGQGHATALLAAALPRMRERGQVVSALFQTSAALYRRSGWELAGALSMTRLRTDALSRARRPTGAVTIRACSPDDLTAVHDLYTALARSRNGLLTRTGPAFPDGATGILELDGVPLAVVEDEVVGYASYTRGSGYDVNSRLTVYEVVAATADGLAALLRHLGSWSNVAPTIDIRLLPADAAQLLLPEDVPGPHEVRSWMLRLVDAPAAIAARGWPAGLRTSVDLDFADGICDWQAGTWRLTVEDGTGRLERGGDGTVRVSVGGLSSLYAAYTDAYTLRRGGLLSCSDDRMLEALGAAFAGPRSAMLDYF